MWCFRGAFKEGQARIGFLGSIIMDSNISVIESD